MKYSNLYLEVLVVCAFLCIGADGYSETRDRQTREYISTHLHADIIRARVMICYSGVYRSSR